MRNRGWYPSGARGNPWKDDSSHFRRWRRRTESVEGVSSISPPRKKFIFVVTLSRKHSTIWQTDAYRRDNKVTIKFYRHTVVTYLIHTFSTSYTQSVTTWRQQIKYTARKRRHTPFSDCFIVRFNTIRVWADRIRMSADRLIVSENAIRILADNYNDYWEHKKEKRYSLLSIQQWFNDKKKEKTFNRERVEGN